MGSQIKSNSVTDKNLVKTLENTVFFHVAHKPKLYFILNITVENSPEGFLKTKVTSFVLLD